MTTSNIYNKVVKVMLPCVLLMTAFIFASCNDWLDGDPKSQIKEEKHFSREGGFKDQLTGIYTKMTTQDMYGLNMGIGFVEVLSHTYDINPNGTWRYVNDFDYTNSTVEATIASIWSNTYNCIANCNILLRNLEEADPKMFTGYNYHIYRGEALGLRAFLHFDLMRLFACAPSMNGNAPGVPYVTEYSTDIVGQKSVNETMQLIINDLREAHDELALDTLDTYDYLGSQIISLERNSFNYFACCATLAKAYLWMGDTQNALKYANEIIDWNDGRYSPGYSWVHPTSINATNLNERDCAFTTEHLFQLNISDWEDTANYYFKQDGGVNVLTPSDATADNIFEVDAGLGTDYRLIKCFAQDGERRYVAKFWYNDGSTFNNRYPLLRFSEAFYIAAECLKNTNSQKAVELINTVRENRGLQLEPLSKELNAEQIQNEIYKEYRKEFIAEHGELFFYYKRLNINEIKGASIRGSKSVFVLPIPSNDQEFGGYSN